MENDFDNQKYWHAPPIWQGMTAVILASGHSLSLGQIDIVKKSGFKTIAINRTLQAAPWADVHYFCDFHFWAWIQTEPSFAEFKELYKNYRGLKVTIAPGTDANRMRRGHSIGLSFADDTLCTGNNSGYQAINLAFLLGAKNIILLGYDQKPDKNGRTHHHAPHPVETCPSAYTIMLGVWEGLAQAIAKHARVINCTPDSAIVEFQKLKLEDAIRECKR